MPEASILNKGNHRCVFCGKVHQNYVSFLDANGVKRRREIADLLLVSLDRLSKGVRLSFLQAKREKKTVLAASNYSFVGEILQFYLLHYRPVLMSGVFPPRTLNFSPAESLTTYGVFYNDVQQQVDFFYVAAGRLTANPAVKTKGRLRFTTTPSLSLPIYNRYGCQGSAYIEAVAIDGIDAFEKDLINWKIGAVVPSVCCSGILQSLFNVVLKQLKEMPELLVEHRDTLLELARDYKVEIDEDKYGYMSSLFPAIMIVEGRSEDYGGMVTAISPVEPSLNRCCTKCDLNSKGCWFESLTIYSRAAGALGHWSEHNNEFLLADTKIGTRGRASVVLKMLRRANCLGIGYYVSQNKWAMREKLKQELMGWNPKGLSIAFGGEKDVAEDAGFVLYAYISDVSPDQLRNGADNLDKTLEMVKGYIRVVAQRMAGIISAHGVWEK